MNNNIIEKMKNESKKYDDYILSSIDEDNDYIIGWVSNPFEENQDTPIIVYDKKSGDFKTQNMPPNYNVDTTKEIWNFSDDSNYCEENKEKIEKMAGAKMDIENKNDSLENKANYGEQKIRTLLAQYGAEEKEIENFMEDLADMKDDLEQINEFQDDEKSGGKDYKEFAETNHDDSDDKVLKEMADDEEKHDDYLLNAENMKLLKATKEGRDLIIKAPEMAKEELKKAIEDYLQKNK